MNNTFEKIQSLIKEIQEAEEQLNSETQQWEYIKTVTQEKAKNYRDLKSKTLALYRQKLWEIYQSGGLETLNEFLPIEARYKCWRHFLKTNFKTPSPILFNELQYASLETKSLNIPLNTHSRFQFKIINIFRRSINKTISIEKIKKQYRIAKTLAAEEGLLFPKTKHLISAFCPQPKEDEVSQLVDDSLFKELNYSHKFIKALVTGQIPQIRKEYLVELFLKNPSKALKEFGRKQ